MTRRGLPGRAPAQPRRRRTTVVVALLPLLCGLGAGLAGCAGEPDTTLPAPATLPVPQPAVDGVDLAGWRLTLPVANDEGNALVLEQAVLSPPWLSEAPDGGLVFWSPAQGFTTKNSEHPRTELVSRTLFDSGRGVHTLRASVTVTQVPQDGEGIILGQIHGAGNVSSVPYVMLRYQDQGVKVVVKEMHEGSARATYLLLPNVPLNTRFDFSISDLGNGQLAFTGLVPGLPEKRVQAPVPPAFVGTTVRFQAGNYQQSDDPAGPRDGGRVIFHRLFEVNDVP